MVILYLSYDGLLEPLGQSQVLQYLKKLTAQHSIHLISYEKKIDWDSTESRNALIDQVRSSGIRWYPLRYHKRPTALATSYDICAGLLLAGWLVWRQRVEIVHSRSYVPSVIALGLKAVFGVKFVFDMRGFWADEKVDNGDWFRDGRLYRIAKWFERRFLLAADCVVSLTRAAVEEMRKFEYLQRRMPVFKIVPTCADLGHFHRQSGRNASRSNDVTIFTLGYVGTATHSYLFDETLAFFKLLRKVESGARLLILNRGQHDFIRERLAIQGISAEFVTMRAVAYAELPREMSKMDACVFFIRQTYSKIAMVPTKLGELLGCGVPCLSNIGVGDMSLMLEREGVGAVVRDFTEASLSDAAGQILTLARTPEIQRRCREAAERNFALSTGVEAYDQIYNELSSNPGRQSQGHRKGLR